MVKSYVPWYERLYQPAITTSLTYRQACIPRGGDKIKARIVQDESFQSCPNHRQRDKIFLCETFCIQLPLALIDCKRKGYAKLRNACCIESCRSTSLLALKKFSSNNKRTPDCSIFGLLPHPHLPFPDPV